MLYVLDERFKITEEEFLLLYDVNRSTNLDFRYEQYPLFDLDDMQNDECLEGGFGSIKTTFLF